MALTPEQVEDFAGLLAADHPDAVLGVELNEVRGDAALTIYAAPDHAARLVDVVKESARDFGWSADVSVQMHEGDDYRDSWKQFYEPMIFGAGALLLRPSWIPRREGDPQRELVLDPGRAFGTGLHESTRLCLEALCAEAVRGDAPASLLDLGCGSGILALAAARLFPEAEIMAIDADPEAAETTRENTLINGLEQRVHVLSGTLSSVPTERRFDRVLANIRPEVLMPLVAQFARTLSPQGVLWLSGILNEEGDDVTDFFTAHGFSMRERRDMGEWCALAFEVVHSAAS